jgi:exopolysaccharide biosynthesis polyprenyl glycosylphosphotransferase
MKERRLFLVLIDLLIVNAAVVAALAIWALRGEKDFGELVSSQWQWFVVLSFLWLVFEYVNGLYDLRVVISLETTVRALAQTFLLVLLAYLALFFLVPTELPRGIVVYHGILAVALIALWRAVFIRLAPRAPFRRRALVAGAGRAGQAIVATIRAQFDPHYDLVGFVDDDPDKQGQVIESLTVLGRNRDLVRLCREQGVNQVVLAVARDVSDDLFRALLDVQELGIEVMPMQLLYEQITARVPVEHIGDSWYVALPLEHAATGGAYPVLKRVFDIALALIGVIGLGALLPFIALALRFDSPGPVFYAQERVGQGGRVFRVRKIRTMIVDAEKRGQAVWAAKDDPRVTRVGKILRKLHLDEAPQFLNILRGEMSVVGPRPERPEFVAQLEKQIPFYRLRHAVKPGMAGWAILHAGYVDSIEDARLRVEYDLYYIKHQSLWMDIWILLRMFGHVLAFRGQ